MTLIIKKSSISGLGLFVSTPYKKGDFIIEYKGKIISDKECEEINNRYIFAASKDRNIDGSARSNTARYINHDCKPNAEARGWRYIKIYASKRIQPQTEITIDYGEDYIRNYFNGDCKCLTCRK